MPRITISYRRDDSGVITGRIFDRLVARYGRDAIFRDIDDIPLGVDFRTHIDKVLSASSVVLAIVGPKWVGPDAAQNRLANPADPVRIEIEAALRQGIPLIPVLVLGAAMPEVDQLPASLEDFAYRNAVQLDAAQDFDLHMARLTRGIDGILGASAEAASTRERTSPKPAPRPKRGLAIGASIAAALLVAGIGSYVVIEQQMLPTPAATVATPPASAKTAPPAAAKASEAKELAQAAPALESAMNAERLFWQSINNSKTAADFEEYLRKYPNGQFDDLARSRLANLRSSAPNAASVSSDVVRLLQAELHRVGCYLGPGDGVWGPASRSALARFDQFAVTHLELHVPTMEAVNAVRAKNRRVCPVVCPAGQRPEGETCIVLRPNIPVEASSPIQNPQSELTDQNEAVNCLFPDTSKERMPAGTCRSLGGHPI